MLIKLNGQIINTESKNILEILEEFNIESKSVAVAVNLEVVKKENWGSFFLKENDVVECLTFMGGG